MPGSTLKNNEDTMYSKIIWLTGLSGVGKTTLAKELKKKFYTKKIKIVDGDTFRKKNKNSIKKITKQNILENNVSIINYIKSIKRKYDIIIVAVISPLLKTRNLAKKVFKDNYFEVYLKCGVKELIRRDTKGLYKLAIKKKIKNLIGFRSNIKYETSNYKKIILNTNKLNVNQCIAIIVKKLKLYEKKF